MTTQFDLNKFNSFLDAANQTIACDSTCQQNKTAEDLKNKYIDAESNLTLADPQYQLAKKNYYTYVSGQSAYNNMIEQELTKKADLLTQQFKNIYDLEKSKITTQLNTYEGLAINFKNIVDLYHKYKNENVELFKKFKDQSTDVLTNERKTYYEDQQNDLLNMYYYHILWVFYILIICCFVIFSLIFPSTYSLQIRIFISLLFAALPFVSTWLLGKTIQFIYWLISLLPKNVYK